MTVKSLKLPIELVEKLITSYKSPKENHSEVIRNGLADFLLLPYEEQILNADALAELLTVEEELTCRKISVRIPDDLLDVVGKLSGEETLSETAKRMLAHILVCPLETADTGCTERLLYVMGSKWNPKMQEAIKHIAETAEAEWKNSVETCAGGLGIFSNIRFAQNEVLNDIDWNKANLLRVIRDSPRELIERARTLKVNTATFNNLKNREVTQTKSANLDEAVRFLYLNLNSVRGQCECFYKNATDKKYIQRLAQIYPLHKRLQNVEISDKDIFDILKKSRRMNTLFIVDPPYLDTSGYEKHIVCNQSRSESRNSLTTIERDEKQPSDGLKFGLEQHQKLAKRLRKIKNMGNDFIYFCRVTATRHKDMTTKKCKNTQEELAKMDRELELKIGKLYFGYGFYYVDIDMQCDGIIERIITSFNFDGATKYDSKNVQNSMANDVLKGSANSCLSTLPLTETEVNAQ